MGRYRRERKVDKFQANDIVGRSLDSTIKSRRNSKVRHIQRKKDALALKREAEEWCEQHGWKLRICNRGHHWIFDRGPGELAEWWPSRAKLVFSKDWDNGIHTHGLDQVQQLIMHKYGD